MLEVNPKPKLTAILIGAGTAGLLLATQGAAAQETAENHDQRRLQRIETWASADFEQSDSNDDKQADWRELSANHKQLLSEAGWSESQVLEQFDHNNDGALQMNEYIVFISHSVDAKLRLLGKEASASTEIKAAADELASESVDGAMIPDRTELAWLDVPLIDSAGIAVPTVNGGYERLSLPTFDDTELVNLNGDVIGEVENVVVSNDGLEQGLVVEVGGFFGLGTTDVLVPLPAVYLVGEQLVWETLLDSDTIEDRASYHYQSENFTSLLED